MWHLIAGLGKSGTTALFQALVDAMPDASTAFEPRTLSRVINQFDGAPCVVAKVLIARKKFLGEESRAGLERFHRRILLIRDPRDLIISKLMYRPYEMSFSRDDARYATYREALARKEEDPASISVADIVRLQFSLDGQEPKIGALFTRHIRQLVKEVGDQFFTYRYEDFVDGKMDELSAYVGTAIEPPTQIRGIGTRVARSARYGDWKHWFTDEDVQTYAPHLDETLQQLGYPIDWTLAADPQIDPAHCTNYADRLRGEAVLSDSRRQAV
jgi:hypothetical protein